MQKTENDERTRSLDAKKTALRRLSREPGEMQNIAARINNPLVDADLFTAVGCCNKGSHANTLWRLANQNASWFAYHGLLVPHSLIQKTCALRQSDAFACGEVGKVCANLINERNRDKHASVMASQGSQFRADSVAQNLSSFIRLYLLAVVEPTVPA